jgi:hypothetical protein
VSGSVKIFDVKNTDSDGVARVTNNNVHVQVTSTAGNPWLINDSGQGHVVMSGTIGRTNSTNIPLATGATFTGSAAEILDYSMTNISVYSDQPSATDGLSIQQSCDGINWDITDDFTIPATSGKTFSVQNACKFYRLVYTNGGTAQTEFRLNSLFKKNMTKPSSHRIQDPIIDDDDAELTKAVLTGKDENGVFRNVNTTVDGDLSISDNSDGLAIAKGDVSGHTFEHKFGNAPDFDTADLEITVWDGAEDGEAWENMVYNYSSTADIDSISSSDTGDTQEIYVEGLNSDWELTNEIITLNGQNRVALANNYRRVFRAYNDNSVNLTGHVFVYVNDTLTGGVPDDPENIRAIIDPDNQQTEMAVYTIPAGKTGYMRDWYMSTSGGNKASSYVFKLKARLFNKIFRTKHTSSMDQLSPIPYQHKYEEPEVFPEKTDLEMRVQSIASPAVSNNAVSAGFDIVLIDN